tara:strand:- start:15549 stop:16382 length:834 start_codon:yes stop_codon:yes gene_type:complete
MPDTSEIPQSSLSHYAYTQALPPCRWAWEFLRRNNQFLADAALDANNKVSIRRVRSDIKLIAPQTVQTNAEKWGLAFFPDPARNGYEAEVFWSSLHPRHQVNVQVSPSATGRNCNIYKQVIRSCQITHLIDPGRNEHLLIKRYGQVIQARCSGLSLLSPVPVQVGFLISETGELRESFRALHNALQIFRTYPKTDRWTRTNLSLRNALIAYDCMTAGRSIRETAIIIYGRERTSAEWKSPGRALKDQIRRSRKKGRDLVNGGYTRLLEMPRPAGTQQ